MIHEVECVVVGAGVVGLAVARALALAGREVIVLEAADCIGSETSSRNSEVIHAGIYYKPGSLIARFCVAGRDALYDYCRDRGVPFRNCGKLIVATTEAEAAQLPAIAARAAENGVRLERISASEAKALEPAIHSEGALWSERTGIIDSHAFMLSLQGEAEGAGAMIAFKSPLGGGAISGDGFTIEVGGEEPMTIRARMLVNSAGLHAPILAAKLKGMPQNLVPKSYFAKGNYFSLSGKAPASRLIYPVPVPGGLGTHLTLDLAGQARFGPDVQWIETLDYSVDARRGDLFYAAIRRYWPDLPDGALQPAYSGIRPKIVPQGAPAQDFVVQGPKEHGVGGLVHLFGIESPGLTASLAIADHVAETLR